MAPGALEIGHGPLPQLSGGMVPTPTALTGEPTAPEGRPGPFTANSTERRRQWVTLAAKHSGSAGARFSSVTRAGSQALAFPEGRPTGPKAPLRAQESGSEPG